MKKTVEPMAFTRMRGRKRIFIAVLLVSILLLGCFGCGNSSSDSGEKTAKDTGEKTAKAEKANDSTIMTLGEYDVSLSEFNLYLIQYMSMQLTEPEDMTDELASSTIETVLSEMRLELVEYLVALSTEDVTVSQEDLDSVETSASNYIETYGEDFLTKYGINQEDVEQLFTEQVYISALTDKAKADMKEDYYQQYSEEYSDKTFHSVYYALFPSVEYDEDGNAKTDDDGEYISLSDDDMKKQKEKAEELQKRAAAGESLEDLIEEYGISMCSGAEHNYSGAYGEDLNKVIEGMDTGDISDVIETEAGYMVVRMDNPDDTDYKEYAIQYAATQKSNDMITQMQQNWLSASGYADAEADEDKLKDVDVKQLCQDMKDQGLY
jgi:parvulin-like peptidyl-prolyl isomerase